MTFSRSPLRRFLVGAAALIFVFGLAGALAECAYRGYFLAKDRLPALLARKGTFDIYAVGDSTMAGKPYAPGLSIPLLVSKMLGGEVAGREIVLHVVARQGDSAGPQLLALAREIRFRDKTRPGVVLIYQGHNDAWQPDYTGPGPQTPAERLKDMVAPRLYILDELLSALERARWIGSRRTIDTYRFDLRGILELSRQRGLTPILSNSIGNVSDIEPGLWERPGYPVTRVRALLAPGLELEKRGEPAKAAVYYEGLIEKNPLMASFLRFRIGKCQEALDDYAAARRSYWEAIDSDSDDTFRRATSAQNEIVRALAVEYSIPFVDAIGLFEANSPHGLVGDGLFADGHHPNIKGVLLLARAYAQAAAAASGGSVNDDITAPQDAFRAFSYGPQRQCAAFLDSGGWLLYVARDHLYPRERLALARERFRAAIALDPDSFEARFGLALAEAADPENPSRRPEDIDWLYRHVLLSDLGAEDRDALDRGIVERFGRDGVAKEDVAQFSRVSSAQSRGAVGAGSPTASTTRRPAG